MNTKAELGDWTILEGRTSIGWLNHLDYADQS